MKKYWLLIPIISLIIVLAVVIAYIYLSRPSIETSIYPDQLREIISGAPASLVVKVDDFKNNSLIPTRYTCDGADLSPKIIIENIPNNTVTLAIIVFDPDAPRGVFYHWVIYDVKVNGSRMVLPEGITASSTIGLQTRNDFGRIGYDGPCPPHGHGAHHYVFLVLALDKSIGVKYNSYNELFNEFKGHVIAYGVYIGVYKRQ